LAIFLGLLKALGILAEAAKKWFAKKTSLNLVIIFQTEKNYFRFSYKKEYGNHDDKGSNNMASSHNSLE